MSEAQGIKETKEVLALVNSLSLLIISKAKDGVQVQDGMDIASALFSDGEIKTAVAAAVDGITKVPAELRDLNAQEITELVVMEAMLVPQIIAALKK